VRAQDGVGKESNQVVVAGGFVLPRCWQLYAAFWCYRQGHLPLRAVRVWLALFEIDARRCTLKPGRTPKFTGAELQRLVGGQSDIRALRRDLRTLRRLGLVSFEKGKISFPTIPEQLQVDSREQLEEQLAKLTNSKRRVPLPRRVVRFLAGAGTRLLVATTLGEAMRLLYWKDGVVGGRGRSKASWIAETFDVDLRGTKRARAHLEQLGLIVPVEATTGVERVMERRWGRVAHWNLAWDPRSGLPPVEAKTDTGLPPVESDNTLLTEKDKNQEPGLPGPATGFSKEEPGAPPPTIANILEADLTSDVRTETLFADAVTRQLIEHSEAGKLRFFSIVEHARRYGTKNRPGLLRALLTKKRWYITHDDEDLARQRLKRLEMGQEAGKEARDRGGEEVRLGFVLERILAQARPVAGNASPEGLPLRRALET
jgi:hypothetical protein